MIIQSENAAADWVETQLARLRLPGFLLGEARTSERSGTRIVRRDYAWGVVFELHAPDQSDRTLICIGEVDEATATVRGPGGRIAMLPPPWKPAVPGVPTEPIPEPGGNVPMRRAVSLHAEEPILESSPPGPPACLGRFRTGAGCEACSALSACRGLQRQAIEAGRTIAEHRVLTRPTPPVQTTAPVFPRIQRNRYPYSRRATRRLAELKAAGRQQLRERVDDTMRCLFLDALDVFGLTQAEDPEHANRGECWLENRAQGSLAAVCRTASGYRPWLMLRRRPRTGTVSVGTRLPVDSLHWGELAPAVQGYVWGAFISEVRGVGGTVSVETLLLAFARAGFEALLGTTLR